MQNSIKPRISVVMPVYNAEEFLHKAIESVLNQDFKDLELILVNDGSTDTSLSICENFRTKDDRVKLISKSNGGVALARNAGLEVAVGEYVIHADADDIVLTDAYSNLYSAASDKNADVVIGDYFKGTIFDSVLVSHDPIYDATDFTKKLLSGNIHGSLCNKLIKKEIFEDISFIPNIDFMEDLLILVKALQNKKSCKIIVLNKPVYHYLFRPSSYTNNISLKYLEIGDIVVHSIDELLRKNMEYSKVLIHFKLYHKLLYLLNINTKTISIRNKFSEVNSLVLTSDLAIKYKILLTLEIRNIHFVSKIYKYLKRK